MTTSRRTFLAGAGAVVAGGVVAAVTGSEAEASPASGFSRSGLGRGVVTHGTSIDLEEGTDVAIDSVRIQPGGDTGWHTHPGPELIVVTRGVLTFHRSNGVTCVTEQVRAGQAFVGAAAGELHSAHNPGPDATEFVVAFFDVPTGTPTRQEAEPPPPCP